MSKGHTGEFRRTSARAASSHFVQVNDDDGRPLWRRTAVVGPGFAEACTRIRHDAEMMAGLDGGGHLPFVLLRQGDGGPELLLEDPGARPLETTPRGDLARALQEAIIAAQALQRVHAEGVTHGHPHPGCIMVDASSSRAWLVGFDRGTRLRETRTETRAPDTLAGRLPWLSPEQTGRMNRPVSYRSDYYALGVTLFERLTGVLPYEATDALGWVHAHIAVRPPLASTIAPSVPRAVAAIVDRMLEKDPDDRYQSARGLLADLREAAGQLEQTGTVVEFALGRDDLSERFALHNRLYGREEEVEWLRARIHDGATGPASLTLVSGYSGIGKSALVGETLQPVTERLGYFAAGKAEQYARNIPYHALFQAAGDLLGQILTEPESRTSAWRAHLVESLAGNAGVLFDVLPSLEVLLGEQAKVERMDPLAERNRFLRTLAVFFQAAARRAGPMVLFLDDLQWLDSNSLELLTHLVGDPATVGLVVLGAYRDNEVGPDHPLVAARATWESVGVPIGDIKLGPLPRPALEQWMGEALGREGGDFSALVELVERKTGSNPFFVRSFLTGLYEDGLLRRDASVAAWVWDVDAIGGRSATDNVVDHMIQRLKRLPEDTQRALRVGAARGIRFTARTVAHCLGVAPDQAARQLWAAAELGFLTPLGGVRGIEEAMLAGGSSGFRFVHDRVQEASYSLLEPSARPALHLTLARQLRQELAGSSSPELLFDVVGHFARAGDGAIAMDESKAVAALEVRAALQATDSGAHDTARTLLERALARHADDVWVADYEFALSAHQLLCQVYALTGNAERSAAVGAVVLEQARTVLDKLPVHAVQVIAKTAAIDLVSAVDEAVAAARLAQVVLVPITGPHEIPERMTTLIGRLGSPVPPGLVNPTPNHDPTRRALQRVLSSALPAAAMSESPYYLPLLFWLLADVVENGATDMVASITAQYGVFLSLAGMSDQGYSVGGLAAVFRDRFGSCGGYVEHNVFIRHWVDPLRDCLAELREGASRCLDAGVLADWGYCVNQAYKDAYMAGESLDELDARYERDWMALTRHEQMAARGSLEIWGQAVACLRGDAPDPAVLQGDRLDIDAVLPMWIAARIGPLVQYSLLLQIQFAYLFGQAERALALYDGQSELADGGIQSQAFPHPVKYWYIALAALDLHGSDLDSRLPVALELREQLAGWAQRAPLNHAHRVALLDAEIARVQGRPLDAMDAYELAIRLADDHPFPQDVALANERAGLFHDAAGRRGVARAYLQQAVEGYRRWGAVAKVSQLVGRFPTLATDDGAATDLDLDTVLKATAALNSEIRLESLLVRMLQIGVEGAGASRGAVVLHVESGLQVRAVQSSADDRPTVLAGVNLDDHLDIPAEAIRYCARTLERLLVDDVRRDSRLSSSQSLHRRNVRSVLCLPLLRQGALVGVLYLENNLVTHAFGTERVRLLEALSTQTAISIENAQLVANLEEKVADRTSALEDANVELRSSLEKIQAMQQQIILLEKLASLGNLTAGVAHELQNPLNFINNFSQVCVELVDDVVETMGGPDGPDHEARELLGDLKSTTTRIQQHGERAAGIIRGMLAHAGHSTSSERRAAEINDVVEAGVRAAERAVALRGQSASIDIVRQLGDVGAVTVSEADIQRVVASLVDNACYAALERWTDTGTAQVVVSTGREDGAAVIRIRDNGAGIPPKVAERLFEPFFTTKPTGVGTGLGLSISHDIVVQGHQGQLTMATDPGEFTEFVVVLPDN